jgi:hypothetical protein
MARYDDLNTNMIAYASVLSIVVLVLVLQGTQALCYNMVNWTDQRTDKTGSEADKPLKIKSEQLESLAGYKKESVIDETAPAPEKGQEPKKKDVIYIPITEAQKLILKEMASAPGA